MVGFMMATMLAVAVRGQAMSFAPNAEGKNQFAPTMQKMETQLAQNTPAIKIAPVAATSAKTVGGIEKKLGIEKTAGAGVGGKTAGGAGEKWKPDVFRLSLLPSLAYFSYEEFLTGELARLSGIDEGSRFMDIKGMVYGFESNLKININPSGFGFMLVPFDLAVYNGKGLTYTGQSDINPAYGSLIFNDEGIFLFWFRGLLGPTITIANHYRLNFLAGYGYKYTENTYTDGGTLAYGLRTNKIGYTPLILQFEYMTEHFSVVAHGEYDIFWGGVQTQKNVWLTNKVKAVDVSGSQTKGYGFRTSIELAYYGVTIVPFFNYFWIDKSELAKDELVPVLLGTAPIEPLNITKEFGLKIGYQF